MTDDRGELYECSTCANVALGAGEIVCCGSPMEAVDDGETPGVESPSLDDLLRAVFGMSATELDICMCVMEGGEQTVADLAERTAYERSVVSRHLNHLAELRVVEKRRRLLEQGGQVYVYSPNDSETVRRNLRRAFVQWVRDASARVDELNRKKVESIVDSERENANWRIYQR